MSDPNATQRPSRTSDTPFIHRHPWIILVAIFLVLIGAWTTMILISKKYRPGKVPLEHVQPEHKR